MCATVVFCWPSTVLIRDASEQIKAQRLRKRQAAKRFVKRFEKSLSKRYVKEIILRDIFYKRYVSQCVTMCQEFCEEMDFPLQAVSAAVSWPLEPQPLATKRHAARSGVKRSEWRARPGSAFFATASSMASALIATNVEKCRKRIKDYQSIKTYRSFFWTMQISDSPALLKASCTPSNSSRLVMVWELKGGTNFLGRICMTCRYATDVKSPTSKFATMSSSN